jgi:hypothetical protein
MRRVFLLVAIISAGLFIYSAIHLSQQISNYKLPTLGEIKGFEETNTNDEYNQLVEKFRQKIQGYTTQAARDQSWYFWLSFVVTALTAGSTLLSSIQAAKKDTTNPSNTKSFAIIIAILTFCSTLSNFASTHFNDLKTQETKNAADLTTMRSQFFADYYKADPGAKASIIRTYAGKLD